MQMAFNIDIAGILGGRKKPNNGRVRSRPLPIIDRRGIVSRPVVPQRLAVYCKVPTFSSEVNVAQTWRIVITAYSPDQMGLGKGARLTRRRLDAGRIFKAALHTGRWSVFI